MIKVLFAINAAQVNNNTLDFACYIAKLTHSKLTGIFLENPEPNEPGRQILHGKSHSQIIVAGDAFDTISSIKPVKENIHFFEEYCYNKGVRCAIHYDNGKPLEEVIEESRFADLLIIDAEISFKEKKEGTPSAFVKNVLAKSECPVVISPYSFYGIDEIVFAYDGSPSSVFAIKQFNYLFPEYANKKMTVLQVDERENLPVIEKRKVEELLQMHYSSLEFHHLQGIAANELFGYLLGKKNTFVVMGSFGRNKVSDFFRQSAAELLVKVINQPIFIAHH